jgi:hypothetical protein
MYGGMSHSTQTCQRPAAMFNPNPHCFIAITKATACGWKKATTTPPPAQPYGGRGKGGATCTTLKICLIKTLHFNYHQKLIENDVYSGNLLNKKVSWDILQGIISVFQNGAL